MSDNRTRPTSESVNRYLDSIEIQQRREDSFVLLELMKDITHENPVMWGSSIVGFGSYHYKYASGREGDYLMTGFAPRKQNLTLYIMPGLERYENLLAKLGKHKIGKSCLYINKLADIDLSVLRKIIERSYREMSKREIKT